MRQTYIVTLYDGDSRECLLTDGFYVHVLNSAWRIPYNDNRITAVRSCWG